MKKSTPFPNQKIQSKLDKGSFDFEDFFNGVDNYLIMLVSETTGAEKTVIKNLTKMSINKIDKLNTDVKRWLEDDDIEITDLPALKQVEQILGSLKIHSPGLYIHEDFEEEFKNLSKDHETVKNLVYWLNKNKKVLLKQLEEEKKNPSFPNRKIIRQFNQGYLDVKTLFGGINQDFDNLLKSQSKSDKEKLLSLIGKKDKDLKRSQVIVKNFIKKDEVQLSDLPNLKNVNQVVETLAQFKKFKGRPLAQIKEDSKYLKHIIYWYENEF